MTEPSRPTGATPGGDALATGPAAEDISEFEMPDDAGNARVEALVRQLATLVGAGELERREAVDALADGVRDIARDAPDVTDVTVRDAIVRELAPSFAAAGWETLTPFEF